MGWMVFMSGCKTRGAGSSLLLNVSPLTPMRQQIEAQRRGTLRGIAGFVSRIGLTARSACCATRNECSREALALALIARRAIVWTLPLTPSPLSL